MPPPRIQRAGWLDQWQVCNAVGQEVVLPPPDRGLAGAARRVSSMVPQPSAVSSTICARQTCFCGLLRSVTMAISAWRSASATSILMALGIRQNRTAKVDDGSLDRMHVSDYIQWFQYFDLVQIDWILRPKRLF